MQNFAANFLLYLTCFSLLTQKTLKMHISTGVWSAQHPNAGPNIQQGIKFCKGSYSNWSCLSFKRVLVLNYSNLEAGGCSLVVYNLINGLWATHSPTLDFPNFFCRTLISSPFQVFLIFFKKFY